MKSSMTILTISPLLLLSLLLLPMKWASGLLTPNPKQQPTKAAQRYLELHLAKQQQQMSSASSAKTFIPGPELPPIATTAKRLFLVRHGEVINPGGNRPVYYGAMDVPLSPLGEQEAQAAADYLSQFELHHIFSSPLSRAIFGAECVLELQKSRVDQITVLPGFKELDRGDWCGKTKDEIGADQMARFDACDESVTPANGESYPQLKQRVLEALETALHQMRDGESACVVSHLQVTRSIVSEALGIPTKEMVGLKVATASVTCVDYDGDKATVHFQSFKPDVGLQRAKDGAN